MLNKVAVCKLLDVANDPVVVQVPVEGSYNWQEDNQLPLYPPVINTLPLLNKVAVWTDLAVANDPVVVHTLGPVGSGFTVTVILAQLPGVAHPPSPLT